MNSTNRATSQQKSIPKWAVQAAEGCVLDASYVDVTLAVHELAFIIASHAPDMAEVREVLKACQQSVYIMQNSDLWSRIDALLAALESEVGR